MSCTPFCASFCFSISYYLPAECTFYYMSPELNYITRTMPALEIFVDEPIQKFIIIKRVAGNELANLQ